MAIRWRILPANGQGHSTDESRQRRQCRAASPGSFHDRTRTIEVVVDGAVADPADIDQGRMHGTVEAEVAAAPDAAGLADPSVHRCSPSLRPSGRRHAEHLACGRRRPL
jgi:hypothetical protein